MAKSKRADHAAPPRAGAAPRQRAAEDFLLELPAPKGGRPRSGPEANRDQTIQAMADPDGDGLDEWLAPKEDADLDQWLIDHGKDEGVDAPDR